MSCSTVVKFNNFNKFKASVVTFEEFDDELLKFNKDKFKNKKKQYVKRIRYNMPIDLESVLLTMFPNININFKYLQHITINNVKNFINGYNSGNNKKYYYLCASVFDNKILKQLFMEVKIMSINNDLKYDIVKKHHNNVTEITYPKPHLYDGSKETTVTNYTLDYIELDPLFKSEYKENIRKGLDTYSKLPTNFLSSNIAKQFIDIITEMYKKPTMGLCHINIHVNHDHANTKWYEAAPDKSYVTFKIKTPEGFDEAYEKWFVETFNTQSLDNIVEMCLGTFYMNMNSILLPHNPSIHDYIAEIFMFNGLYYPLMYVFVDEMVLAHMEYKYNLKMCKDQVDKLKEIIDKKDKQINEKNKQIDELKEIIDEKNKQMDEMKEIILEQHKQINNILKFMTLFIVILLAIVFKLVFK